MKRVAPMLVIICAFFTSFKCINNPTLKDVEWIIGDWVNRTGGNNCYETWQLNGNVLKGKRLFIHHGDTLYYDKMSFTIEKGNLVYYDETLVPSQMTNKLPPPYTIQQVSDKSITIENVGYDALIRYSLISTNLLVVEITDSDGNSKFPVSKFNLTKAR